MTLKLPKEIDWSWIGTSVYRIFIAGCAVGGVYAASVFASKEDVEKAIAPYVSLPPRVERLEKQSVEREDVLKRIAEWQVKKDEVTTRLTVLFENQQRMIDRQQQMMDRQQAQIDELNRRR